MFSETCIFHCVKCTFNGRFVQNYQLNVNGRFSPISRNTFSETGKEDQLSEMSDWNVQVLKDSVFVQLYTHLYMCSSHVQLSFSINMICTLCKCMYNICITFTVIFIQRLKQFDIFSGCRSGQTSYVGQVRNLDQSQIELNESASL